MVEDGLPQRLLSLYDVTSIYLSNQPGLMAALKSDSKFPGERIWVTLLGWQFLVPSTVVN